MNSESFPPKKSFRRKQYIINRPFQFTLIGYTAILAVILLAGYFGASELFFLRFESMGREMGFPDNHVYFEFLRRQHAFMSYIMMGVSLFTAALLAIGGIIVSHRIAGPIYKLCRRMSDSAESGDLDEVYFRKNDFFPELAIAYNAFVRKIRASDRNKTAA